MSIRLICSWGLLLTTSFLGVAQVSDSTTVSSGKKNEETIVYKKHSPTRATLYSTFLPGLGQVYNKKPWKVPIIYGLGGWLVYNVSSSHNLYADYRDALNLRQEFGLESTDPFRGQFSDSQLKTRKEFYKKRRDMNVIYALLLYSANIIDAAVDAHLMHFHVGEKYIMSLEPTFLPTASVSNSFGLSLTVNFK